MRLLLSGILLFSAQCANAANSCDINAIVQHAWPDATPTTDGFTIRDRQIITISNASPQRAICRVWPAISA